MSYIYSIMLSFRIYFQFYADKVIFTRLLVIEVYPPYIVKVCLYQIMLGWFIPSISIAYSNLVRFWCFHINSWFHSLTENQWSKHSCKITVANSFMLTCVTKCSHFMLLKGIMFTTHSSFLHTLWHKMTQFLK